MAPQDGPRAVDLFSEHGTGQFMGKRHAGKGEEQVGVLAPSFRDTIVAADEEDKILPSHFGFGEELGEVFRFHGAAGWIEINALRVRMPGGEISLFGLDLEHLHGRVMGGAADEIFSDCICVRILWLANVIKKDLQAGGISTTLPARQRRSRA